MKHNTIQPQNLSMTDVDGKLTSQSQYERDYTFCRKLRELDETFDTDPNSPLHHDNRCKVHDSDYPHSDYDPSVDSSEPTESELERIADNVGIPLHERF